MNAKRTFSVRGLLFVTACLPLSNAAIFTCVLLFTHTCPVTPAFLSLLHHPVFQHAVIAQQLSNHRLVNLPENRLFECFKRHRQLHFQRRSAVHQLNRAVQKLADIVDTSPYLRYAAVYAAQAIHRFHRGADGILGRENSITTEYSANCPRNAALIHPSGITSGRSPARRGIKNAVIYGIIVGVQFAWFSASSSI